MAVDENEYKTNKRLKRFPKIQELLDYDEETNTYEVIWTQRNIDAITNIVKIVVQKHFAKINTSLYDELVSHALTRVVDVLISNEFDYKNYGTTVGLKNFLYTVARNSLTDYTYHYSNPKKECFYDAIPDSVYRENNLPIFSENDVDKYLDYFYKRFPTVPKVEKSELVFLIKAMGFDINAKATIPTQGNEYNLEKALSLFPKYYINRVH